MRVKNLGAVEGRDTLLLISRAKHMVYHILKWTVSRYVFLKEVLKLNQYFLWHAYWLQQEQIRVVSEYAIFVIFRISFKTASMNNQSFK
jgi:hypothetical protein